MSPPAAGDMIHCVRVLPRARGARAVASVLGDLGQHDDVPQVSGVHDLAYQLVSVAVRNAPGVFTKTARV